MTQHATWKHVLAWTATAIGGITIISGAFSSHLFLRDLFLGAAILLPGAWWLVSTRSTARSSRRWPLIVILSALLLLFGVLLTPAAEKGDATSQGSGAPYTSTVTITTATPDPSVAKNPPSTAPPSTTKKPTASEDSPDHHNEQRHRARPPCENNDLDQGKSDPQRVNVPPGDPQREQYEEEPEGPRKITYIEETIYEEVIPGGLLESEVLTEPADEHYSSCQEARDAGAAPLYPTSPGYSLALDKDQDGVACEEE
ncbi:excalibur calcium-binding domain-containing protein [Corynebacterium oculi]|uniref:Excalibur calcium-binding domain protein n=1 Tax=Corynebacterium oculi TaxID=1544416 RepID=A0A0Q0U8C3_9CORY|nr:excalibur calcium-binding domain-containing protein [Corynebacterium oculi]KQB83849.1 Excalibur calcium-binding domain protein [Corynebacterium oculi]